MISLRLLLCSVGSLYSWDFNFLFLYDIIFSVKQIFSLKNLFDFSCARPEDYVVFWAELKHNREFSNVFVKPIICERFIFNYSPISGNKLLLPSQIIIQEIKNSWLIFKFQNFKIYHSVDEFLILEQSSFLAEYTERNNYKTSSLSVI